MPLLLGLEIHIWANYIAFIFALLACILCSLQIWHHIKHDHHPITRKYVLRILLMVIVYSINAWFVLKYPSSSIYLDMIRELYEAFVIYAFFQLLIQALDGFDNTQVALSAIGLKSYPHPFPFNYCCKSWSLQRLKNHVKPIPFLRNTTIGVIQYCFMQIFTLIAVIILELYDVYGEGEWKFNVGYPYIVILKSLSQTYSIYCLILLYSALKQKPKKIMPLIRIQQHDHEETVSLHQSMNINQDTDYIINGEDNIHLNKKENLNKNFNGYELFIKMRPIPKFLSIKGIVFCTYWQGVIVAILVYTNVIHPIGSWSSNDIAVGIQNLLICIEMFFFSIAHWYAFKIDDYPEYCWEPITYSCKAMCNALFQSINIIDIINDAKKLYYYSDTLDNQIYIK